MAGALGAESFRTLDSPANESTVAKLCERYDLTISDVDPEVRCLLEVIVPHLRDHALWLLGEPGKGKTPLGRILAMKFSRFHGGKGTFRTSNDLESLQAYDSFLHKKIFTPSTAQCAKVFEVVGDGHTKVEQGPHTKVVPARTASQNHMHMDGSCW